MTRLDKIEESDKQIDYDNLIFITKAETEKPILVEKKVLQIFLTKSRKVK